MFTKWIKNKCTITKILKNSMNVIVKKIEESRHIVVIAHVNPDMDSLSSASAMYTYLLTLHKKVSFFCATSKRGNRFDFLPWIDKVKDSFPSSADLAISLDCASVDRLGVTIECDLINIDHHLSNNQFGTLSLVDSTAISTTKVLYDFFQENQVKINQKMATALYAGLLDDSHGFLSDEVDGTTFAVAKELIECGAAYHECNKYVMKSLTLGALRLKAIMLANMQLLNNAQITYFEVRIEDLLSSGAIAVDCEYALEESMYLQSVKVAVLLKENRDLSIKVSLRSGGKVDVAKIAKEFGGGGHSTRAGFITQEIIKIDELKNKIIDKINKEI